MMILHTLALLACYLMVGYIGFRTGSKLSPPEVSTSSLPDFAPDDKVWVVLDHSGYVVCATVIGVVPNGYVVRAPGYRDTFYPTAEALQKVKLRTTDDPAPVLPRYGTETLR